MTGTASGTVQHNESVESIIEQFRELELRLQAIAHDVDTSKNGMNTDTVLKEIIDQSINDLRMCRFRCYEHLMY